MLTRVYTPSARTPGPPGCAPCLGTALAYPWVGRHHTLVPSAGGAAPACRSALAGAASCFAVAPPHLSLEVGVAKHS
eukprot:10396694-Alexandrium_andersonii.AAC.1